MWMMRFSCHNESSSAVLTNKSKKKEVNLDNDTSLHRLQCNGRVNREVLFFPYAKKKNPQMEKLPQIIQLYFAALSQYVKHKVPKT